MEIEKTLTVAAPREQIWAMLLDPQVMGGAVPGMKSIEVLSPTEYVAVMHQKIAFISAKFKLRTTITEQRAPEYLCAEGTGEDASVASSLKQRTEVFLSPTSTGGTELRIKVNVDLLGRLGTFGLSVMKTKADRLWEEFGANLAAKLEGREMPSGSGATVTASAPVATPTPLVAAASAVSAPAVVAAQAVAAPLQPAAPVTESAESGGWWSRLTGRNARQASGATSGRFIRVEVRQLDKTITVDWPVEAGEDCQRWLRELIVK